MTEEEKRKNTKLNTRIPVGELERLKEIVALYPFLDVGQYVRMAVKLLVQKSGMEWVPMPDIDHLKIPPEVPPTLQPPAPETKRGDRA